MRIKSRAETLAQPLIGDDGELLEADPNVSSVDPYTLHQLALSSEPRRMSRRWIVLLLVSVLLLASLARASMPTDLLLHLAPDNQPLPVTTSAVTLALPLLFTGEGSPTPDVYDVEWSADGTQFSTTVYGAQTRLWDAETGVEVFFSSEYIVGQFQWSPDGSRYALRSAQGLTIWNTAHEPLLTIADGRMVHSFAAWSLDGTQLATVNEDGYASVAVYDALTGTQLATFSARSMGISEQINEVIWTQNGLFLKTGHTVIRWYSTTGDAQIFQHLDFVDIESPRWFSMAASVDGRYLALSKNTGRIGEQVGDIFIWDTAQADMPLVQTIHTPSGHSPIRNLIWSPDGTMIAAHSVNELYIWEHTTGENVRIFALNTMPSDMDWSPDGQRIVLGGSHGVRILSLSADE